jgi:hypothetical protein
MQKCSLKFLSLPLFITGFATSMFSQNVGVLTNQPQAPFHVASSGQVNTPGGLMILGDTTEAHLEMDFDILQSKYSSDPLLMHLQPEGGDLRIGTMLMHLNATDGNVGIGTITPDQKLDIEGSANQLVRIHTTSAGSSRAGIELLRSTEFSGTDWRFLNDGGTLRLYDGIDNFLTDGDLNMTITTSGNFGLGIDDPVSHMHIAGTTDQFFTAHRTTGGAGMSGINLLRDSEFAGTDWRIVNDGGSLKFLDAINNFTGAADLNMTLTQGGNLGIGTDSPASRLHIAGSTDQFLKVQRTTSGTGLAGIDLLRDDEFQATDWRIVNDGGTLKFLDAINNFTGAADLNMTLTSIGHVGIGIDAPESPLHIVGSEFVSESGDGFLQIGLPGSTHVRFDNNEILARNGDSPSLLYLQYWSGNLSLCDNASGRVGIGTGAPQAKLHITDGTDVSLSSGGELVLGATGGNNIAMDGNEIQARNSGAGSALFLQSSGGDVLLVPNETGQVGIGITSSATLPSPDYLLAVDGKIISEEVRVEISGSWPDYVFDKDYPLMPLAQLEDHITTYGHLPGVPSANRVENEGILLGDMNRMLLEKIEELTLHVIAMQKEIDQLKATKP